jgi:hypothetical protein
MSDIGKEFKLDGGYTIRVMDYESFCKLFNPLREVVFDNIHSLFPKEYLSEQELDKCNNLHSSLYKDIYYLSLGLFDKDDNFVGWSVGSQQSAGIYYMGNSAVLEGHRRKGLYTAMLKASVEILKEKGFQIIFSRHNVTNNHVIIPKLKAGFIISSIEVDDVFGTLVHLRYYPNKTRRKVMDYRCGHEKPDEELKKLFNK